jgi:periplasmic divalent cation tolerance protein
LHVQASTGKFVQVLVAVPSARLGARMARALVGSHLAACVQIVGPVQSHYRWRGRIERAREWLLLIKTRAARVAEIEAAVRQEHPYTLPEILVVPVRGGFGPYLDWLRQECGDGPPGGRHRTSPKRPSATRSRRGRGT